MLSFFFLFLTCVGACFCLSIHYLHSEYHSMCFVFSLLFTFNNCSYRSSFLPNCLSLKVLSHTLDSFGLNSLQCTCPTMGLNCSLPYACPGMGLNYSSLALLGLNYSFPIALPWVLLIILFNVLWISL